MARSLKVILAAVVMPLSSFACQADEWKVIRVCDKAPKVVPAEYAHTIKEGSEKDCGIYQ